MATPSVPALFRPSSVPLHQLVMLVRAWGFDAGLAAEWLHHDDATVSALIDPDAGRRAHWRCALQLARACEQASGRSIADLLADLDSAPAPAPAGAA